jgi:hypothetical protein
VNCCPTDLRPLLLCGALTVCLAVAVPAYAQPALDQPGQPRFSEVRIPAVATGEELAAQSDLWVMDVYFKPLRMIVVELTDPQTGVKKPEYVWYLAYRAINRPLPQITQENPAVNELDPPVLPPKFIPEGTLVTNGSRAPQAYQDRVIPEALAVIRQRERMPLQSSVSAVQTVPPPAAPGAADERAITGVLMFTGVDPRADYYTIYLTGFSNGVRLIPAPGGGKDVQNKTIEMKYWRPGDEFELREPEIRLQGEPQWIYR